MAVHLPSGYRTMAQTRERIAAAGSPVVPPPGMLEKLTGVRGVHVRDDGEQCSDLAVYAVRKALAAAGTSIGDVDLLLFAAGGQDLVEPATAHIVAAKLGASCPVFDVKNACNSVLNAVETARAMIESGLYRTVLIACGEAATTVTRWHLPTGRAWRESLAGFTLSDAGAALLLTAGPADDDAPGVLATRFFAASSSWRECTVEAGGSMHPRPATDEPTYVRVNGDMMAMGERHNRDAAVELREELRLAEHAAFIGVHQISVPQFRRTVRNLPFPDDRYLLTVADHGNAAAASLPLQLALARESGRVAPGDLVALIGMASGYSAGVALIRM